MIPKSVDELLKEQDEHLPYPDFGIFGTGDYFSVIQYQPLGVIGKKTGIETDIEHKEEKLLGFIRLAKDENCQLALTPECSFSLELLKKIIATTDLHPNKGKLWCLGMEYISMDDFMQLESFFNKMEDIVWIAPKFESEEEFPYCNWLIYIFRSGDKLVLLPQLKIKPFESSEDGIINKGMEVYVFEGGATDERKSIFATLICSDVFHEDAPDIQYKYKKNKKLIVNLQLNPKFKHDDFTSFFEKFFERRYANLHNRILVLNWAAGTQVFNSDGSEEFKIKHGYSALYEKYNDKHENDTLINRRNKSGIRKGRYRYTTQWYNDFKEHILLYHMCSFRKLHDPDVASKHRNGKLYHFNVKGDMIWSEVDDHSNYCASDWEFLNEVFGVECRHSASCRFNKVEEFICSFDPDPDKDLSLKSFQLFDGRLCVAYKMPEELKTDVYVVNMRGRLRLIANLVKHGKDKFPYRQKFSEYSCFSIDDVPKSNLVLRKDGKEMPVRVIYCGSSAELAVNLLYKANFKGVPYDKYLRENLLCYDGDSGLAFFDRSIDSINADITIRENI